MRRKKSPTLGNLAAHAEAWCSRWPQSPGYRLAAQEFARHVGPLTPAQLTDLPVNALIAAWAKRFTKGTAWQRRAGLLNFLRYLQDFGAPKLQPIKLARPKPREVTATDADIRELLKHAKPHMQLFILLCWQLALRRSEALAVTPRSWDSAEHTVTIRTKGGKVRCIPTTPDVDAMLALTTAADPDASAIAILDGRPSLQIEAIQTAWWRLAVKCGVPHLRPHDLRRTTATQLYRISHDVRAVQQYLGHDQMTSTLHYLAPLSKEDLEKYHELLSFQRFTSQVKQ